MRTQALTKTKKQLRVKKNDFQKTGTRPIDDLLRRPYYEVKISNNFAVNTVTYTHAAYLKFSLNFVPAARANCNVKMYNAHIATYWRILKSREISGSKFFS